MGSEIYKPIPKFTKYAVSINGQVIIIATKQVLKARAERYGTSVSMADDRGNRTTRRPHLLIKEVWGDK